MKRNSSEQRWEVALSQSALVHFHYETNSMRVLTEGLQGLAKELRELADQIEAVATHEKSGHKREL